MDAAIKQDLCLNQEDGALVVAGNGTQLPDVWNIISKLKQNSSVKVMRMQTASQLESMGGIPNICRLFRNSREFFSVASVASLDPGR